MGLDYCESCQSLEGGWTDRAATEAEIKDFDLEPGAEICTCDQCGSYYDECHINVPEHDDVDMER